MLSSHRSHDVPYLLQRWRSLARKQRVQAEVIGEHDGYPLLTITGGKAAATDVRGGFYASTGIHGDEVGATEGMYLWAQRGGLAWLQERGIPFLLAPCQNPWGVANNRRTDARGRDLNRCFGPKWPMPNRALRRALAGWQFDLALTLHEDFDAQGLYLYEVRGPRPYWGEKLMASVAALIAPDRRGTIEERRARGGVIRPELDEKTRAFLALGMPEALWLFFEGTAERVFTFETPSEYALDVRTETHARLVEEALGLAFG